MGCSSSTSRMRGERSGTVCLLRGYGARVASHGGVLDHRVYRAAFLPALVALFVLAFSLTDVRRSRAPTRLAPLRLRRRSAPFTTMRGPGRSASRTGGPGSTDDAGLADRVAEVFEDTGFAGRAGVERRTLQRDDRSTARPTSRPCSPRARGCRATRVVVIAHRDAAGVAGRRRPVGHRGAARARAPVRRPRPAPRRSCSPRCPAAAAASRARARSRSTCTGPVDAVFVLGDLAGEDAAAPVRGARGATAPARCRWRSSARRSRRCATELAGDPGRTRAAVQLLRRALPLTARRAGRRSTPRAARRC